MGRWWKEVVLIGALGASAGTILPRLALPPLAHARRPPASRTLHRPPSPVTHETGLALPLPGEIAITDEAPAETAAAETAAPTPDGDVHPGAPAALPTDAHADAGVAARRTPARHRAPLPAILVRRGGRWQLDLREEGQPRQVFAGVRLAPTGGDSATDGYRLLAPDRMGLLTAAGVRTGDVLVAVNGSPLRNPDDALEVFARSRRETHFTLRFRRGASAYTVPVDLLRRAVTANAR